MESFAKSERDAESTGPDSSAWKEYRLLLYSALVGIAGGLAAQIFVWLLNLAE